jgi:hypothetical protein
VAAHRWKDTFGTEYESSFFSGRCGVPTALLSPRIIHPWQKTFRVSPCSSVEKTSARSDLQSDLTEYLHFQCALHIFSRIINPDIPDGRITNPTERRVSGAPEQTESTCLSVHICAQRSVRISPCSSVAKCQLLFCYLFFALFVVDTTYYSYLCGDINKKSLGKGHCLSINNNCIAP